MSLIEDAKAAQEAGLTYGQYMMVKKPASPKPKPDTRKYCANCGDVLTGGRVRFCCSECRAEMRVKNRKGDKFV